jgi:hypothetical protein
MVGTSAYRRIPVRLGGAARRRRFRSLTAIPAATADGLTVLLIPTAPAVAAPPPLRITSSETGTVACSLDGNPSVACSPGTTDDWYAPGQHAVAVRARDLAGDRDPLPARREWLIS